MPPWLQVIAHVNPLTYAVDGLRSLMLAHALPSASELGTDFGVLFAITVVLVAIAAWLYPRLVQ